MAGGKGEGPTQFPHLVGFQAVHEVELMDLELKDWEWDLCFVEAIFLNKPILEKGGNEGIAGSRHSLAFLFLRVIFRWLV
jgi:hypothetical protein